MKERKKGRETKRDKERKRERERDTMSFLATAFDTYGNRPEDPQCAG